MFQGKRSTGADALFSFRIGRQALYDLLALTGSKPSFLLWDKVYTKLTTVDEEFWFVRALSCAFLQGQSDLLKNETLR